MTLQTFAQMLDGRQYNWDDPWTDEELEIAKNNNFVIVNGREDNSVKIQGAIDEDVNCFDGCRIFIDRGFIIEEEEFNNLDDSEKEKVVQFEAKWCKETDENGKYIEWTYNVLFPHKKIKLYKDDVLYCVGFVFELQEYKTDKMTLKEFAQRLDERQYSSSPWTYEELKIAENNHFVIVSGQSDDLVKIRGAINAEVDCFLGGKIYLLKNGRVIEEEKFNNLDDSKKEKVIQFEAKWWEEKDEYENSIEWTYDVPFPHEKIKLYDGNWLYCVGFVFELQE